MTAEPNAVPQDTDPDLTEILDVKPKNKFTFRNPLKPTAIPKVGKPVGLKPTLEKPAAVKVPVTRMKRGTREPGQAPREVKPGLKLATTAQQRKLIPLVGVFLLLGAISLYVNLGGTSTAQPASAFVGPGPGQPGYIPAPGTMNPGAAGNPAGTVPGTPMTPPIPGSDTSGTLSAGTAPGTAAGPSGMTGSTTGAGTGNGVTISTTPPPIPGSNTTTVAGPAGTSGSAPSAGNDKAGSAPKSGAGSTSKSGAGSQTGKPGSAKSGAATTSIPRAPGGKPAPSPTDVSTEPAIPDVFSVADAGQGNAGGTGGTRTGNTSAGTYNTGNGTGSGNSGQNGPVMNVVTQPPTLRNVPLAAVPRQVQIAQAAPLSIQSLPAPTPAQAPAPVAPPVVRTVPTLSAVPAPVSRVVINQVPPPVAQSLPLPAPITASTPQAQAQGVTLTRNGVSTTFAPPSATTIAPASPTSPAAQATPAAPSVLLIGTASGETPTAILSTPAGQMIAGIGDHVTVNDTDYTVSKINTSTIILTHLKDTLTLTETN